MEAEKLQLNESQWKALDNALSQRLTLIWGPPGTGKSETLRAIVRATVLDTQQRNIPLRILVTANNYNAVDNVLLELEAQFRNQNEVEIYRLQSKSHDTHPDLCRNHPKLKNIELEKENPDALTHRLLERLNAPQESTPPAVTIVGTVPHQIHNLALVGERNPAQPSKTAPVREWFDLVILDEASQMDVSSATIIFAKAAPNGCFVLAGDHLQLPPIHQAVAPEGLESLVGSVYDFLRQHHQIRHYDLDVNYRSNGEIVDFLIEAGYETETKLTSYSRTMRLNLVRPLPLTMPQDWPQHLAWSPDLVRLINPQRPLSCFIYDDELSGQSNAFEAQTIASLIRMLHLNLAPSSGRRDANGILRDTATVPYSSTGFWSKGMGVVAPHRAQVGRITALLRQDFLASGETTTSMISGAVDTVERYQGQQREVILASLGLGDPELIALEDEFLFDHRRFNVLVSRACVKVVILMSRSVVEHLSNDQDVVRASGLLKRFAELYCRDDQRFELPYFDDTGTLCQTRGGLLRSA